MRKLALCICENKDADQLRSKCEADQRLCFRYTDSTIPLLPKSEIQASSHLLWLFSLVCIRYGRKPRRQLFSRQASAQIRIWLYKQCITSSSTQRKGKYPYLSNEYELSNPFCSVESKLILFWICMIT